MAENPEVIVVAVTQLLGIVTRLNAAYSHKAFTLDGRLVGDLGEILAEHHYELELLPGLQKVHDAKTPDGRHVQIKATMKQALTFPSNAEHVPEVYLGIRIRSDGGIDEIFNGPGSTVAALVRDRKPSPTGLHTIPLSQFRSSQNAVELGDRVRRRPG